MLVECMKRLARQGGIAPALWKADIDSAYRRIPLKPEHRWAAWSAFVVAGVTMVSGHLTMPFGAVAAVHAWNRVGALLAHIARCVLLTPVLRFVDDFFSVDHPECVQHAMECFARIVRALLGVSAIADKKLEYGCPLVVLGLNFESNVERVRVWPTQDKLDKWSGRIRDALDTGFLKPGMASKLAGALNWASQHVFHRLGRAMLRPLYRHQTCKGGRVGQHLRLCLEWWLEVMNLDLGQCCEFGEDTRDVVELFCDARGHPARLAAVIYVDNECFYTDWAPPEPLLQNFKARRDNQIMGLELLAIALGLSTFETLLQGRRVRIWSDNVGGEAAMRKGSAKEFDHNCIVHCIWLRAAAHKMALLIERVASKLNIADLPSREDYRVLEEMGAVWRRPFLDEPFWRPQVGNLFRSRHIRNRTNPFLPPFPQAWESLSLLYKD